MSETATELLVIAALGVATYALRIGGYLVLARFERLNPRVEAALDAVPPSVLAAMVAPVALATGIAESIAVAITVLATLRLPILPVLAITAVAVSLLRAAGL